MSEPQYIDPSKLRQGPIRHESLPPELLDQIKAVFDLIGRYTGMNLVPEEVGRRLIQCYDELRKG